MRFQAIEERLTGCDSAALTCHALAARTDGHLLGLVGTPAIPLAVIDWRLEWTAEVLPDSELAKVDQGRQTSANTGAISRPG